eukprot:scaffold1525_cov142-Cylindrotheca_fusiformis.AAC.113
MAVKLFVSNCNSGDGYYSFQCKCCNTCCAPHEGPEECNKWDWEGNWDPAWEHGFRKDRASQFDRR